MTSAALLALAHGGGVGDDNPAPSPKRRQVLTLALYTGDLHGRRAGIDEPALAI